MPRDDKDRQVFYTFGEARHCGFLSRSWWRRQGRLVSDDVQPAAIVIKEHGKVRKEHGPWDYPVLSDDGTYLILAFDYYEVFSQDQTIPKPPKGRQSTKRKEDIGETPIGASSMTEEKSQVVERRRVAKTKTNGRKPSVNNVRAYVPEGLVLPEDLPTKHEIWWFLGLIYWKHLENRLPWDKTIPLKWDFLKENIPQWPEVWDACQRFCLVERDYYSPGERSYGYCTAEPYRDQVHRLKTFEHKLLAKRLRAAEHKHESRPVLKHLRLQLERLSVDMDEFDAKFSEEPNRRYYLAHLQTIIDGYWRFTIDDFSGRLHTNITNMFKPLRALLRVDDEPETLGEIDIKNSQPLFCGLAALQKGIEDRSYLNLSEVGELYDHIAGRLGVLRESAKMEVLKFFYAKNGFRSAAKRLFEAEFPQMAAFIAKVKDSDHKRLARHMQEAERKFVIDVVCERLRRLRSKMFLTTIHDSFLTQKADCDFVVTIVREEFERRGVKPQLAWKDVAEH